MITDDDINRTPTTVPRHLDHPRTPTTVPKHLDRPKRRSLPVAVAVAVARTAAGHVARNAPAYLLVWTLIFPIVWLVDYEAPPGRGGLYQRWQKFIKRFAEEVERVRGEQ